MSNLALRVDGLGKRYRLGIQESPSRGMYRYKSLRDSLGGWIHHPLRTARQSLVSGPMTDDNAFWALKDVDFEVKRGEVVGIIGRNGAGKSTLLKILSRITRPTTGRVDLFGRVGSLLEVGTGFHPELTGRENIYLNGAILGMTRAEVRGKFDEIVAFSEIEKFLDMPVKQYSSGMHTRLAFAVAAHLEPEILIVDEVLAVGDVEFQKKCLGKMKDVARGGRTVLFVSHNMQTILRLCSRSLLFKMGEVAADGDVADISRQYMESDTDMVSERQWKSERAPGSDIVHLKRVRVCDDGGQTQDALAIEKPLCIEVTYNVTQLGHVISPNVHIYDSDGQCVFVSININPEWHRVARPVGDWISCLWIPANLLAEGRFSVRIALTTLRPMRVHVDEADAVTFEAFDSASENGARGDYVGALPGVIRPKLAWTDTHF